MIRPDVDPDANAVYAAESTVEAAIGPALRRWADVVGWTTDVANDERLHERFPTMPLDISIGRRSRSASASLASVSEQTILIRDGSWNALTVLHELAHLIAPLPPPHGPRFRATLCELVRITCGLDASVMLDRAYRGQGLEG